MQTHTTPLAPYGSMNHLALVAKVGAPIDGGKTPGTRTVVRRAAIK